MTIAKIPPSLIPPKLATKEPASHSSERIKAIAMRALTELAIAFAFTAVCIPFVASWAISIQITTISLAMALVNSAILELTQRILHNNRNLLSHAICSASFYQCSAGHAMTLVHETGHFCAAKLLFKGNPQMRIIPFVGGWTKWSARYFTSMGLQMGYRNSIFLITFAGTGLALLAASITLVVGLALRHAHPHASSYLIAIGVYPFVNHTAYALSALWTAPSELGHDFVRLRGFGIPPIAAASTILAIPIIIFLGAMAASRHTKVKIPIVGETALPTMSGSRVFEPSRVLIPDHSPQQHNPSFC